MSIGCRGGTAFSSKTTIALVEMEFSHAEPKRHTCWRLRLSIDCATHDRQQKIYPRINLPVKFPTAGNRPHVYSASLELVLDGNAAGPQPRALSSTSFPRFNSASLHCLALLVLQLAYPMSSCLCFRNIFPSTKKPVETAVIQERKEEKAALPKMTTQTKSQKVKLPRH